MKIALALPALGAPDLARSRACALARRLGRGGQLVAVAADDGVDAASAVARLGCRDVALVSDPALARLGVRARAAAVARLLAHLRADLVLIDAHADEAGLFGAALAHHAGWAGILRAVDVARAGAAIVVTLELGGKRHTLRLTTPAVVSVLGESTSAPAPLAAGAITVVRHTLAELGLAPRALPADPRPAPTRAAPSAAPEVVTSIDELLR